MYGSLPASRGSIVLLQLDAEVLEDLFLDLPRAGEGLLDDKGVAGADVHGVTAVWRDGDLALDHVHEFDGGIGRVVGAGRGRPPA